MGVGQVRRVQTKVDADMLTDESHRARSNRRGKAGSIGFDVTTRVRQPHSFRWETGGGGRSENSNSGRSHVGLRHTEAGIGLGGRAARTEWSDSGLEVGEAAAISYAQGQLGDSCI